jgi:hypothetical protein
MKLISETSNQRGDFVDFRYELSESAFVFRRTLNNKIKKTAQALEDMEEFLANTLMPFGGNLFALLFLRIHEAMEEFTLSALCRSQIFHGSGVRYRTGHVFG